MAEARVKPEEGSLFSSFRRSHFIPIFLDSFGLFLYIEIEMAERSGSVQPQSGAREAAHFPKAQEVPGLGTIGKGPLQVKDHIPANR